ncbi:hypothetical protein Glove_454g9 [Diversispora epigaea]|uniref:Uncharacterized protein n=1 Tax=Diversispora epigaea TaxID=1348612 RepID=A0A397GTF6_9GLOM|nr:hypothetical protein Glove_454g9 [Diversispora epigaea]
MLHNNMLHNNPTLSSNDNTRFLFQKIQNVSPQPGPSFTPSSYITTPSLFLSPTSHILHKSQKNEIPQKSKINFGNIIFSKILQNYIVSNAV